MEPKRNLFSTKFKIIFYLIIIIFACLYFAAQTGYYEKKIQNDTLLTKEAILKFEEDIQNGEAVDIKDYISKDNQNFNNKYSHLGYTISNTIDIALNDGVEYILKILKTLFN